MKTKLEEYSLKELATILLHFRMSMLIIVVVTFILSLIIAITTPKEYVTDMLVMPEVDQNQKSSSLLSRFGVGSLFGETDNSTLSPLTYSKVFKSIPFQEALLQQEFYFSEYETKYGVKDYFVNIAPTPLINIIEDYTIKLPFTIKKWLFPPTELKTSSTVNTNDIRVYGKADLELIVSLSERIEVTYDEITGLVNIKAKMQDPIAVAQYLEFAFNYLKDYITKHKQERAQNKLTFLSEQLKGIKKRYEQAELSLASYKDRNLITVGNVRKIELLRLENDFHLNSQLYSTFRQKVEEAKIQLNDDKPIIKIVNPISVPIEKEEPKRMKILAVGLFLGCFLAVLYVIVLTYLKGVLVVLKQAFSEAKNQSEAH